MGIRPYDIAVSAKTFWLLQRIAKARRAGESALDTSTTPDKVAEEILSDHLKQAFPELLSMFEAREKVNAEAEGIIAKAMNPTPTT